MTGVADTPGSGFGIPERGRTGAEIRFALPGMQIVGELGRGSQGVVYRARGDGRDFAVKVLLRSTAADDAVSAQCRREAALVAWVNHPGLPAVHEVGEVGGRLYLVMDLIEGSDLRQATRTGPLSPGEVVEIGAQVGAALAAVHQVGLIHRDIKPSNVILQADGQARLIDFGLAGRAEGVPGGERADVGTAAVVGTLAYAAPEQAGTLNRPVDARSDLYALGVVLFECVTGQPPYSAADVGEMLRLHATAPVPDPRTVRPEVSDGLAAVLIKLLAKDPDDRYQTAFGLVADLHALAAEPTAVFPLDHAGRSGVGDLVPLVGRDAQLASLVAAWTDVRAGHGRAALIRGGTGSGKTRLARELAGQVFEGGYPVLSAGCASDSTPLSALRDAIDSYLTAVAGLPELQRAHAHDILRRVAGSAASLVARLSERLAEVLGATCAPPETGQEAFVGAVAGFLADFAHAHGAALLSFDDVQHLDEATGSVLRQLALHLDETPLLLLSTAGDAVDESQARATVRADLTVTLEPLDEAGVAALVVALARATTASEALVERLVARGAATPLEVQEYVAAIVDAGLLIPHWGTWTIDLDGLDALALPADVVGLIVRRLDRLDPQSRRLLTMAAVIGPRFAASLAAAVSGLPVDTASVRLEESAAAGILEARGGEFVFTHESLRAAVLDELGHDERRDLHQRIAETLADAVADDSPTDPARIYLLAQQYLRGSPELKPSPVITACLAAGRLALADSAPKEALGFLEPAAALADPDATSSAVTNDIRELLGAAYHAAGRFTDAIDTYTAILEGTTGRLHRARLLAQINEAHASRVDIKSQLGSAYAGLAELGRPLPTNPVVLVLTSVAVFLAGLFVATTRLGFGTARGKRRAHLETSVRLYDGLAEAGLQKGSPLAMVVATLRTLYPAARLGPSRQYANALCVANTLIAMMGLRTYRGGCRRAHDIAVQLNDPGLASHVTWISLTIASYLGTADDNPRMLQFTLTDRHLPLHDYTLALYVGLLESLSRGNVTQARDIYEAGLSRLAVVDVPDSVFFLLGLFCDASSGRVADADVGLRRAIQEPAFTDGIMRVGLLAAGAQVAVEQQDLGPAFDRFADEFAALGLKPRRLRTPLWLTYIVLAYGRIEQCVLTTADQRKAALAAATHAVDELGQVTTMPVMKAHHVVAVAYLRHLHGDHDGALAVLAAGDRDLRLAEAPWADFEAARLRARALTALGRPTAAAAQAGVALLLAETCGWPHRVGWIRQEFPSFGRDRPGDLSPMYRSATGGPTHRGDPADAPYNPYRQRLTALEQISHAASSVLDPTELTRIALDEAIRILGAERAYLFLTDMDADDPDTANLLPHLGRDADGTDIDLLAGYGSTLVDGVRRTHEPVVVTGSDEGAVLGSKSAVVYGLRSILIAPMLLDGHLRGVIYLDSRIAKGIFTTNDVGILTTITNFIASAIETARAAQLAVAVHAAEQRRDVAETIRHALAEMTATLDPAEVLTRLVDALRTNLPGHDTRLVLRNGDKLILSDPDDPTRVVNLDANAHPDLMTLMATSTPVRSGPGVSLAPTFTDSATGCALPVTETWLAIPLAVRDDPIGLVLLCDPASDGYGDAQTDLAGALTGQGMIAYDNARLFARVQQLASVDELTGLLNRRQFYVLAHREITVAHRHGGRLAAFMVDIDHFKRVNDTHGHHTGDQVIQTIARLLRTTVRDVDIVGRYGGEEFAVVLPDIGDNAGPIAERLVVAVNAAPVDTDAGALPITISIGVADLDTANGDLETLLADADHALYAAKNGGRNRACHHRETDH